MFTVRLIKPLKNKVVTYHTELVSHRDGEILLLAHWNYHRVDLGYVVFEPNDTLYEYFYTERWYNIFRIHAPDGTLKGWYCNITRPAIVHEGGLDSEDLELDLFVSPDRQTLLVLDEDEYQQRGIAHTDPAAHTAAQAALAELQMMARQAAGAFQV